MRRTYSLLLFAFMMLFGVYARAEAKLAYVDLQRALLEVEDGKKAKAKLEKLKNDRQKKLDAEQESVKKLQQDFETQKSFMTDEVRAQKTAEFQEKFQQLQMTYANLQKELVTEEAKVTREIFNRMGKILETMGKTNGYTMILEKTESSILWAEQSLDLTNELIRRYNAGEGK